MSFQTNMLSSNIVVVFKPFVLDAGLKTDIEAIFPQPSLSWILPNPNLGINLVSSRL